MPADFKDRLSSLNEKAVERAYRSTATTHEEKLMSKSKYALVIGVAAVALAGCGPDASREDSKDVGNVIKTPPEVLTFNNHYPNVETKCDGHGHRVFVSTHDSSTGNNMVIIDDPTCSGGGAK